MKGVCLFFTFISFILTIINFALAYSLKYKSLNLYKITKLDSQRQFEYLSEVLIVSNLKLHITAFAYDIIYILLFIFLSKCIFNENQNDQNMENIRIKAMKENEVSNLFIEFFSLFFIKGIALGFGFFYSFEIIIEIKKIIKDLSTPKSEDQLNILQSILLFCTLMKWINLFTMFYLIWLYTLRFIESCCYSEDTQIVLIRNDSNYRDSLNERTTRDSSLNMISSINSDVNDSGMNE